MKSFSPKITKFPDSFINAAQINRFLLATADKDYMKNNSRYLVKYESSDSEIPLLCGIFTESTVADEVDLIIKGIFKGYKPRKVYFFLFTCERFRELTTGLADSNEIKINFVKTARFNLIPEIWHLLGIVKEKANLSQYATYVIDLDFICNGEFDREISNQYGDKSILVAWNSKQSPNKNYPINLIGSSLDKTVNNLNYIKLYPSYKIIKAGFSCFAPSSIAMNFLEAFKFFSIGHDDAENSKRRLFSFYYGDQLCIFLSLNEIKSIFRKYERIIGWIDIYNSEIVNLSDESYPLIWLPKGINKLSV